MNYFDILFAKYKFEKDHPPIIKRTTGNPIVLTDAADAPLVECVTQITGSQDLHGYDKPWVGGAGKNKCIQTVSGVKTRNSSLTWVGDSATLNGVTFTILSDNAGNVIGYNVNGTASELCTFSCDDDTYVASESVIVNGRPQGAYGCSIDVWRSGSIIGKDTGSGVTVSAGRCALSISVARGTTVDNKVFYPMIRLASESDSTFAPYSNICPITTYTEGEIEVRGKNILPLVLSELKTINTVGTWNNNVYTLNNMNFTVNTDGSGRVQSIRVNGNTPEGAGFYLANNFVTDGSVFLSGCPANGSTSTYYLEWVNNGDDVGNGVAVQTPVEGNIRFRVVKVGTSYDFVIYPMLESGTAKTDYEPYLGTTHTTTFPSAIYRGSEDVVNGEVTTQKIKWTRNSATMNNAESYPGWNDSGIADLIGHGVSGRYTTTMSVGSQYAVNTLGSNDALFLPTDTYGLTQTEWIALAVDIDIVIELPTPTTSSVTPTNLPIKSLSGFNHIESSTGELDITYLTQNYQNFVDIIENNLGTRKKGGIKPLDVFRSLEVNKEPEEEEKKDEKVEDVKK